MFFSSPTGKLSNSKLSDNTSGFGGGFYSNNAACNILLYNTKIFNNAAVGNSGGGKYVNGELTIDGDKSNASNNVADEYGGGIIVRTKGLINNCIICNNKALRYDGGGVVADGELTLNNAKIYKNWSNQRGGGVYYEN